MSSTKHRASRRALVRGTKEGRDGTATHHERVGAPHARFRDPRRRGPWRVYEAYHARMARLRPHRGQADQARERDRPGFRYRHGSRRSYRLVITRPPMFSLDLTEPNARARWLFCSIVEPDELESWDTVGYLDRRGYRLYKKAQYDGDFYSRCYPYNIDEIMPYQTHTFIVRRGPHVMCLWSTIQGIPAYDFVASLYLRIRYG